MGWKTLRVKIETGFQDSNGNMICIGDVITYPKRVRAGDIVETAYGKKREVKGYTYDKRVKVVGFGRVVKTKWDGKIVEINYINVETFERYSSKFRLYRTDKTSIMKIER